MMRSSIAEEIRNTIALISESVETIRDDSNKSENPDIDTDAATDTEHQEKEEHGLEKIEGSFNVQELINVLEIPKDIETNFRSAMYAIRTSEEPHLTKPQALALATAFDHVLLLSAGKKQQFLSKVKSLSPNQGG